MAPAASDDHVGPHPSYIELAKPYILQSRIQKCLDDISMSEAREDAVRLQGVSWIDNVRRALQLPVRTFNTAVVYYHKFRLWHGDAEYNWADAAAAALFTACKIEDTLKKSREILCANWNLKVAPSEQLSPDDPRFENHSKLIIGLERLMLESASFDFRNRYPQKLLVKLARAIGFKKDKEGKTAWNLSIDLYRTFAPLKHTSATMAIACIELAARLHQQEADQSEKTLGRTTDYKKWNTSKAEVMESLLDLLDLYTHHRTSTLVGPFYPLEKFIEIRIALNNEASAANLPRYALYASEKNTQSNGAGRPRNGIDPTSPLTPATPLTASPAQPGQAPTSAIGIRGQNGTVRFMLDAVRARDERAEVDRYHKVEEEEYEVEVPNERERPTARANQWKDTQSPVESRDTLHTSQNQSFRHTPETSGEDWVSNIGHRSQPGSNRGYRGWKYGGYKRPDDRTSSGGGRGQSDSERRSSSDLGTDDGPGRAWRGYTRGRGRGRGRNRGRGRGRGRDLSPS